MYRKCLLAAILIFCIALTTGCTGKISDLVPKEEDKFARDYINTLKQGDFETAESLLDPQLKNTDSHLMLQKIGDILNSVEISSVEVMGFNVLYSNEKKRTNLSYQAHLKDSWLLVNVTVDKISGKDQVFAFNVNPINKPLQEINAFTLYGKSLVHYIFIIMLFVIPIFIIFALITCIRTKVKLKWLWIIFILMGFFRISLNWSNGQLSYLPISFLIPGAGISKSGEYAPWIISLAFPLGAVIFLLKRNKLKLAEDILSKVDNEKTEPQDDTSNQVTEELINENVNTENKNIY